MKIMTHLNLPPFSKVIESALPGAVCDGIIDHFKHSENTEKLDMEGAPTFTQLNLNVHHGDMVKPLTKYLMNSFYTFRKSQLGLQKYVNGKFLLEEFRVKRYNSNSEDRFDPHVDVNGGDSLPRLLAFLFYLNDDFEGGQTHFLGYDAVRPRQGSVLIFPPYWTHPHAGLPVKSGTKYIMSSYLHFG